MRKPPSSEHKTKFKDRTIKGVFLGYSHQRNGYEILDLSKKIIYTSKDVTFIKDNFPFKQQSAKETSPKTQTIDPICITQTDTKSESPTTAFDNTKEQTAQNQTSPRRSDRPHTTSDRYGEWVYNATTKYPMVNYVSYNNFTQE